MSKEKQIEEIAKILLIDCEGACTDCEYYGRYGGSLCIPMRLANELYNAGYRKQEWISVDERLPTWEDGKVLVFTHYGFSICERTVNSRWQGKHANWITHWMPLPEAPKMKGGAE